MNYQSCTYHTSLMLLLLMAAVLSNGLETSSDTKEYNDNKATKEIYPLKKAVYRLIDILRPVRAKRQLDGGFFFIPEDLTEGDDYEGGRSDPNGRDPHEQYDTTTLTSTSPPTKRTPTITISDQLVTTDLSSESGTSDGTVHDLETQTTQPFSTKLKAGTSHIPVTLAHTQVETSTATKHKTPDLEEETLSSEFKSQPETSVHLTDDEKHITTDNISTTDRPLSPEFTTAFTESEPTESITVSDSLKSETTNSSQISLGVLNTTVPSTNNGVSPTEASTNITPIKVSETNTNQTSSNTVVVTQNPNTDGFSINSAGTVSDLTSESPLSSQAPLQNGKGFSDMWTSLLYPMQDTTEETISQTALQETVTSGSRFSTDYGDTAFSTDPFFEEHTSDGDVFLHSGGSAEASGDDGIMYYTSSSLLTTETTDHQQGCVNCREMKTMMEEFAELKKQNQQLQLTLLEVSNSIAANAEKIEHTGRQTEELIEDLQLNVSAGQLDVKDTLGSLLSGMESRLMEQIENSTAQHQHVQEVPHNIPSADTTMTSGVVDLSMCVYHTRNNQSSTNSTDTCTDWTQQHTDQSSDGPAMKVSNAYCVTYGGTSSVLHRMQTDPSHWLYRCVCSGKLLESVQRFCELHIWECPL